MSVIACAANQEVTTSPTQMQMLAPQLLSVAVQQFAGIKNIVTAAANKGRRFDVDKYGSGCPVIGLRNASVRNMFQIPLYDTKETSRFIGIAKRRPVKMTTWRIFDLADEIMLADQRVVAATADQILDHIAAAQREQQICVDDLNADTGQIDGHAHAVVAEKSSVSVPPVAVSVMLSPKSPDSETSASNP